MHLLAQHKLSCKRCTELNTHKMTSGAPKHCMATCLLLAPQCVHDCAGQATSTMSVN